MKQCGGADVNQGNTMEYRMPKEYLKTGTEEGWTLERSAKNTLQFANLMHSLIDQPPS